MIDGPSTRLWVRVEAKENGLAVAGKPERVFLEFMGHGGEGREDDVRFPLCSQHEVCVLVQFYARAGGRNRERRKLGGRRGRGKERRGKVGEGSGSWHILRRGRGQYGMGIRGKRRRISDEERIARPFPRHARARALS